MGGAFGLPGNVFGGAMGLGAMPMMGGLGGFGGFAQPTYAAPTYVAPTTVRSGLAATRSQLPGGRRGSGSGREHAGRGDVSDPGTGLGPTHYLTLIIDQL